MNLDSSMPPEKWMKSAVFRNFSLGVVVVALDTHPPTAEKNEDEQPFGGVVSPQTRTHGPDISNWPAESPLKILGTGNDAAKPRQMGEVWAMYISKLWLQIGNIITLLK